MNGASLPLPRFAPAAPPSMILDIMPSKGDKSKITTGSNHDWV